MRIQLKLDSAIVRYVLTSALVYLYIVAALHIMVEFFRLDKVLAYAVVYLLAYVMEYTITLLFVFRARFKYRMTIRYVVYVASFLAVSTLTYKTMLLAGIDYLYAAILTAFLLSPARYAVSKYWVYR